MTWNEVLGVYFLIGLFAAFFGDFRIFGLSAWQRMQGALALTFGWLPLILVVLVLLAWAHFKGGASSPRRS